MHLSLILLCLQLLGSVEVSLSQNEVTCINPHDQLVEYWGVRHQQTKRLGDTVSYRCRSGYMKSGGVTQATCTRDGWTPKPLCEAVTCRLTLTPMEGTTFEPVYRNVFSPGETVRVNCGPKYWISDHQSTSAVTTCQEDGEWSLRPLCQEVTCINPHDQLVQYWGVRHWQTKKLGDTASYSCKRGYKKSGGVTQATCTRDGWTPKPLCGEIICNKQDVPNAVVVRNDKETYKYNERVTYNCNEGYRGGFTLTCEERGWTGNPECREIICNKQDVLNATIVRNDKETYKYNESVTYNCTEGYRGGFTLTCEERGWTGNPECPAQQCPVIYVDNNVNVNGDAEEATYGNVVRFSCKSSTEVLSGSSAMFCDENGEWVGTTPKCEAIKCTVPVIENGYVPEDTQEYNENEVLHFRCNSGYTRDNRPSMCKKIGSRADWSPTPACEPVTCRLTLPPMEGTTFEPVYRNVFAPGETARVNCGPKYWISDRQSTSAVTTCQEDGEWTLRPICQEVTCINPRDQLVQAWGVYYWQTKKLGDTASYSCKRGYKKSGGVTQATCTRDGWTPKPLCEEIICNKRDVPNAVVVQNDKETYKYNERVRYDCNEGYRGGFTLTCGERGWTGNPQCPEITCGRRPSYQNAHPVGNYQHVYKYNDQVKYICINDHEGSFTVTCGATGWNGAPQCTIL